MSSKSWKTVALVAVVAAIIWIGVASAEAAPPGKGKYQLAVRDAATGDVVSEVEVGKCYLVDMRKVPLDQPAGFSLDLENGLFLKFFRADLVPDGGNPSDGVGSASCVVFPQEVNGVQTHGVLVVVTGATFGEALDEITVAVKAEF